MDFTNCERVSWKAYSGANGKKIEWKTVYVKVSAIRKE